MWLRRRRRPIRSATRRRWVPTRPAPSTRRPSSPRAATRASAPRSASPTWSAAGRSPAASPARPRARSSGSVRHTPRPTPATGAGISGAGSVGIGKKLCHGGGSCPRPHGPSSGLRVAASPTGKALPTRSAARAAASTIRQAELQHRNSPLTARLIIRTDFARRALRGSHCKDQAVSPLSNNSRRSKKKHGKVREDRRNHGYAARAWLGAQHWFGSRSSSGGLTKLVCV